MCAIACTCLWNNIYTIITIINESCVCVRFLKNKLQRERERERERECVCVCQRRMEDYRKKEGKKMKEDQFVNNPSPYFEHPLKVQI